MIKIIALMISIAGLSFAQMYSPMATTNYVQKHLGTVKTNLEAQANSVRTNLEAQISTVDGKITNYKTDRLFASSNVFWRVEDKTNLVVYEISAVNDYAWKVTETDGSAVDYPLNLVIPLQIDGINQDSGNYYAVYYYGTGRVVSWNGDGWNGSWTIDIVGSEAYENYVLGDVNATTLVVDNFMVNYETYEYFGHLVLSKIITGNHFVTNEVNRVIIPSTGSNIMATKTDIDTRNTITGTAGETLTAGNICYLKSDGKFWKSQATAEATTAGLVAIATASASADGTCTMLLKGIVTDTLTAGSTYYIATTTAGAKTLTRPSTSGQFVRVLGYALSSTQFYFNPDSTYIEIK